MSNIQNQEAVPTGTIHEDAVPTGTINQGDPMGSIQLVEEAGDYVDPRVTIKGQVIDIIDLKANKYGKLQRSARVQKDDGTTLLVSGFGTKAAKLEVLQLGGIYTFKGKVKTKKTTYEGKEQESTFMNI